MRTTAKAKTRIDYEYDYDYEFEHEQELDYEHDYEHEHEWGRRAVCGPHACLFRGTPDVRKVGVAGRGDAGVGYCSTFCWAGKEAQSMATAKQLEREAARAKRMQWWHDARFGMFVHWGLYSQVGRHEWVMNRERIPLAEYEKLANSWQPKPWPEPRPAREWAKLAREAGQKYMVMTTKHHEGFCLWDTKLTDYNSVQRGPKRDLVAEYVEACREFDLKIGFYYSLMDWHHPDGARCAKNEAARRRFIDYTQGLVRELMSNYGKIDILWYDVSWPLDSPEKWESKKMNAMVRKLQPQIIINDRSQLPEDFGTPEERITASDEGRAWEACMTFNGSWGWMQTRDEDWHSARQVVAMLRQVAGEGGNLLLNIGPLPDGSVPPQAVERLKAVGKWLQANGEAFYGEKDRVIGQFEWNPLGKFTAKGNTAYFWCSRWPGRELVLGGFKMKLKKASFLANGKPIQFTQEKNRIVFTDLPAFDPDPVIGVTVLKLEFASKPKQVLGSGCVVL
jgi:alpha-L-fucosidase